MMSGKTIHSQLQTLEKTYSSIKQIHPAHLNAQALLEEKEQIGGGLGLTDIMQPMELWHTADKLGTLQIVIVWMI